MERIPAPTHYEESTVRNATLDKNFPVRMIRTAVEPTITTQIHSSAKNAAPQPVSSAVEVVRALDLAQSSS